MKDSSPQYETLKAVAWALLRMFDAHLLCSDLLELVKDEELSTGERFTKVATYHKVGWPPGSLLETWECARTSSLSEVISNQASEYLLEIG